MQAIKLRAAVLILALALAACGQATDPPPAATTYQVIVSCAECGTINVWATADRAGLRTTGTVAHGSAVTVLGTQSVDGVRMYNIRAGNVTGWLSELMIGR